MMNIDPILLSQGLALFQVIFIDLVMAGDNAVAVGIAASGLPSQKRRLAIMYGLIGAVVLRIGFVLITVELLEMVGLLLAGGVLLMWVCWKMWRELHEQHATDQAEALIMADGVTLTAAEVAERDSQPRAAPARKAKTLWSATLQILAADISMSLDNVLAVSGAAQHHIPILVFGLLLSIAAMGLAANFIATILHKYRWIAFVGVAIVLLVALRMMWEGAHDIWEFGHCDATLKCVPVMAGNVVTWWQQVFASLLLAG